MRSLLFFTQTIFLLIIDVTHVAAFLNNFCFFCVFTNEIYFAFLDKKIILLDIILLYLRDILFCIKQEIAQHEDKAGWIQSESILIRVDSN